MTPALFNPDAAEGLDLFMGETIGRARDLYDLDGEIALFRRDGRVVSFDADLLDQGGLS